MTGMAVARSSYLRRTGATFRGLINDLKRNEQAAADELGVDVSLIRQIIEGERPVPMELVETACRVWPVNERDFFPLRDGSPDGVSIMREQDSAASSRVFQRAGRDYYEYRDTAMNPIGMIRPEWIRILQPVADCEAGNPAVQWNNGHFLYQFTYFVGEVNYYYESNGQKHCARMETGDSVFGLPFARHSFATRQPALPGLILALTYGGRLLGDAQHELGVLGNRRAGRFVLPSGDQLSFQAALLAMHMSNAGYSTGHLAQKANLPVGRLEAFLAGEQAADMDTLARLAQALRVSLRELLPVLPDTTDGVVIARGRTASTWVLPDAGRPAYRLKELARSCVTPYSRSLELEVLDGASDRRCVLETGLHQYGYHLGSGAVSLEWEHEGSIHSTTLRSGDSFYIEPFVPHSFKLAPQGPDGDARLLILRVGGKVVGDARLEASIIGGESMRRVVAETNRWYNMEGSR